MSEQLLDIDLATRALYDEIARSALHGAVIRGIETTAVPAAGSSAWRGLAVVLVPGIFYRDYPHTGADGSVLREVVHELGLPFELVDSDGTAGLTGGSERVLSHLLQRAPGPCVMFSLSKGSAEILEALRSPRAARAFAGVEAWVSVSGIPLGTAVFDHTLASPIMGTYLRGLSWIKGWRLAALRELLGVRAAPQLNLPRPMHVLHVAAFPQREHLRDRRSRRFHRLLAPHGPNDGFVRLQQLLELPGTVYPLWGADHYLRAEPALDLPELLRRCLAYYALQR